MRSEHHYNEAAAVIRSFLAADEQHTQRGKLEYDTEDDSGPHETWGNAHG